MIVFFLGIMFIGCEKGLNSLNVSNASGKLSIASRDNIPVTFSVQGGSNRIITLSYTYNNNIYSDTIYGVYNSSTNSIDIDTCTGPSCQHVIVNNISVSYSGSYKFNGGSLSLDSNNKLILIVYAKLWFSFTNLSSSVPYSMIED